MNISTLTHRVPLIESSMCDVEDTAIARRAIGLMITKVALSAIFSATLASGSVGGGEWQFVIGIMGMIISHVVILSVMPGQMDVVIKAIRITVDQPEDFVNLGEVGSFSEGKPCAQMLTSIGSAYIFEEITSALLAEIGFVFVSVTQGRYIFLAFSAASLGMCILNIYNFWNALKE